MIHIKVIAVGKLQRMYQLIQEEFVKRLSRYARAEILEVADEPAPEKLSAAQKDGVMLAEWEKIRKKIGTGDFVVVLDASGKKCSSEELAVSLGKWQENRCITFVLGGSLGLYHEALNSADEVLSLSDMTFTHSMARTILLEQLYRGFKINTSDPYHK